MDPTSSMFESVMYPTALFSASLSDPSLEAYGGVDPHETSPANPKNRLDSFHLPKDLQWKIDDVDADGTRFFAVPSFAVGRPPLRVDVYIPDQLHHPPALRATLQPHKALLVGGRQLSNLGISRLILQRLHHWSVTYGPDLEVAYWSLPFGSRIIFGAICGNLAKIPVHLVPNYDIERQWLTVRELQELWQLAPDQWPPILDHEDLQLECQVHEAISVVRIARRLASEKYAFKSVSTDVKYLYHELRMLLTMERHRHIIPRPLYVVTKKCRFGGRIGVCGFVVQHFPLGTLRDALQQAGSPLTALSTRTRRFPFGDRLRWAQQVLSALEHISSSPMGFYTDLKPNNILLSQLEDGSIGAILIDFEQRGSWYSWSPPEVYYVEYLEQLAASPLVPETDAKRYAEILKRYIPDWTPHNRKSRYNATRGSPVRGYSQAWLSLSAQEQQSAQVFMVGKLLWCIFEALSFPNSCVTVETFREEPSNHSFPEFRLTPAPIRAFIRQCTAGAPEWSGRLPYVVRVGNKLFPRNMTGRRGEPEGTLEQTQEAARSWWREEIRDAERLVAARARRRSGCEEPEDARLLEFLQSRPSLAEVESVLGALAGTTG